MMRWTWARPAGTTASHDRRGEHHAVPGRRDVAPGEAAAVAAVVSKGMM